MHDSTTHGPIVDIRQLRIGLHVHLDLGWMQHPFPLNSFRIASEEQLQTLRGLGLEHVRILPQRSDVEPLRALVDAGALAAADAGPAAQPVVVAPPPAAPVETPEQAQARRRREALEAELACAHQAERQYAEAGRALKRSFELAISQPAAAREHCETHMNGLLGKLLGADEMAIRLLSEGAGDRASLHAVNVTVLSLLLGKQLGLSKEDMFDLGTGAMLHDVGKLELPDRVRWLDPMTPGVSNAERQFYQDHVSHGVTIGRKMGLMPGALLVLAQHHELADGSGFPLKLAGEKISPAARIVALINRYDNLCNPATPSQALTPHEALALIYGQMKARFDSAVFGAFIRMMGVYPPGSVVQLSDDRYGMVVTVNAARPLKPCVLVHDPKQSRDTALPLDLERTPELGIRRSLKPQHLPRATLDYLSPRTRTCYFFEPAREMFAMGEAVA
ncbi:HD-GYP domain-containing protein [uncultured Methylibium sp.]|uniref:HD-GYP domain-containing protein n=1 Tax=uncultured Methylibium sp. TaxID=381093 RepID=UPI0025DFB420|nr:HD-GYP domain-containing protein [uncultured Methylibium sp.]